MNTTALRATINNPSALGFQRYNYEHGAAHGEISCAIQCHWTISQLPILRGGSCRSPSKAAEDDVAAGDSIDA